MGKQQTESGSATLERLYAVPRLYLAGHNVRRGQAVMREYQPGDEVRYYPNLRRATRIVAKFNRIAAIRAALSEPQA